MNEITLNRRNGIFSIDLVSQYKLFQQLKKEAGIKGSLNDKNYNSFLSVAGDYGYWIAVIEK